MESTRTLVFEVVSGLHVLVSYQETVNPTDGEWDAYVAAVSAAMLSPRPHRALVVTNGGHPSAAQQGRLRTALAGRRATTAVVSGAPVLRFLVSAFTFVNPDIKCFAPAQMRQAFEYVGLRPEEHAIVEATLQRLRQALAMSAV